MAVVEDVLGEFGFRVAWEPKEYMADFKVFEVVAICQGAPEFEIVDGKGEDFTPDISLAQEYMNGTIKWDGCSHIYSAGYWHMCGMSSFAKHVALMKYLHRRAFELMGREPDDKWADHEDQ